MTTSNRTLVFKPARADLPVYALIGLWLLSMIAVPLLRAFIGDAALGPALALTVLLQAAAVFFVVTRAWGLRPTAAALFVIALVTWLAEAVGSRTGFPFGYYYYTDRLQPQLLGVPLLIPLAWFMMLPPAWAVAQTVVGMRSRAAFIAVSALALTAWDLFLDPQKVAWGFWVWTDGSSQVFSGGYFGVPWVNFLGWLVTASIVTFLVRPAALPVRPLLIVYTLIWLFQTMGQLFFWGLFGPAVVGFVGMGIVVGLAWRTALREQTQ
jgi:Predicted membrane protein